MKRVLSYALAFMVVLFAVHVALAADENPVLPDYEIVVKEPWEAPIKSQMALRIIVKGDSITEAGLRALLLKLYREAKATKGWKYHKTTTNVYVYAYTNKGRLRRNDLPLGDLSQCCGNPPEITIASDFQDQLKHKDVTFRDLEIEKEGRKILDEIGIKILRFSIYPNHVDGKSDYAVYVYYDDSTARGNPEDLSSVMLLGPFVSSKLGVDIRKMVAVPCLRDTSNERARVKGSLESIKDTLDKFTSQERRAETAEHVKKWSLTWKIEPQDPNWKVSSSVLLGKSPEEPQSSGITGKLDGQKAKLLQPGQVVHLTEVANLMPELHPKDPLKALKNVAKLPVGTVVTIRRRDYRREDTSGSPWYFVSVVTPKHGSGEGWINCLALIGQEAVGGGVDSGTYPTAVTLPEGICTFDESSMDKLLLAAKHNDERAVRRLQKKRRLRNLPSGLRVYILKTGDGEKVFCQDIGSGKKFWTLQGWLKED